MLTDNERKWLERRERHEYPFCISCGAAQTAVDGVGYCYPIEDCPLEARIEDWQEAAEFEERVAAKLAIMMYQLAANSLSRDFSCEKSCVSHLVCQKDKSCIHSFMKYARIAVEEEMDDRT